MKRNVISGLAAVFFLVMALAATFHFNQSESDPRIEAVLRQIEIEKKEAIHEHERQIEVQKMLSVLIPAVVLGHLIINAHMETRSLNPTVSTNTNEGEGK